MIEGECRLNRCFKEANESRARYKVLLGSAGSGKSVNVAQDYILKLSSDEYRGCSLLVVRGAEVSHLNSTFAELTGAISRMGLSSIWESKLNPLTIRNTHNGNTILFRGCNDQRSIERLKSVTVASGKICFIWIEEATELESSDFEILNDRLRGVLDNGYYQITMTFNPISGTHWIKGKLWDIKRDDIFTHKSTYLDNTFIDEDYKKRMDWKREVDPEGFEIYGLGNWGESGGLVFSNIQVGDYIKKEFDFYTLGADWGFNHATAILLVGWKSGEPYIVREVYSTGKTTAEIIAEMKKTDIPRNVLMYCDSAEPDRIKEMKQAGYKAYPVSKEPGSVNNCITWLKQRTIFVDGRCINSHRELQQYRWKKDPTTGKYLDTPVPIEDDCIAALRYSCEQIRKEKRLRTMSKGALGL